MVVSGANDTFCGRVVCIDTNLNMRYYRLFQRNTDCSSDRKECQVIYDDGYDAKDWRNKICQIETSNGSKSSLNSWRY